ncbi:MAG: LptF/LptG family permease [Planctomycetota bacterium]|nr:LptF/LptG family permease [Planctomycetota bacterium]
MRTLHSYLARELAKTFLLTCVALTLLIVMGGGVANVFRAEGVGAKEMASIFIFLTPVALTMILPISALFSATITFGRASADNEIAACRAAGVNVQRLLLTPFLLGLLVTGLTYVSWNYVIPKLFDRIESLTRRDLPSIVLGQFERGKPLVYGNFRICAEEFEELKDDRLPEKAEENHTYLYLSGVTFLQLQDEQFVRYGTSDYTLIDFDSSQRNPCVTAVLYGVHAYDVIHGQEHRVERQDIPTREFPFPIKQQMKFQDVGTLRSYLEDPRIIPELADRLFRVRRGMMQVFLYDEVFRSFDESRGGTGTFELFGPNGLNYKITTSSPLHTSPMDNEPTLFDAQVIETLPDGSTRTLRAGRLQLDMKNRPLDPERPLIVIELSEGVRIQRSGGGRLVEQQAETLPALEFVDQPEPMRRASNLDLDRVMDPTENFDLMPTKLKEARAKLIKRKSQFESEVLGEIHFRSAYSVSAVAVILIGAMLGIILRGGQVLTAFGISCVPTAVVVIASIVGRNMANQPGGAPGALAVMWGTTILAYIAVGVIASRVLRL